MIKKIQYIYQFLYYSSTNKYSLPSFFPISSIIIGTIIIFFTLGIMDGMEGAIFKRMNSFNFTYKGSLEIPQFVNENFDIYKGSEKKYLIFKNNAPKVITITAISDFEKFKDRHIKDYLSNVSDAPGIIIGKGLARILNVKVGDKVSIASPLDVDLITGIAPIDTAINISGIFNYNIMDYDYNYAFISNSTSSKILKFKDDRLFLKSNTYHALSDSAIEKYNFIGFKDINADFLKAINTERLLYSLFGYIVIFIAAASSVSLMSLFIIKKKKQIAILRSLGFKNSFIINVLLFNSLATSFLGVFIGTLIFAAIVSINNEYYFIQELFFSNLSFSFLINFDFVYIVQAFLISAILMSLGSIYPILKILETNLVNVLNEKM